MLVSVITPTTGNPLLKKALQSVQAECLTHLVSGVAGQGRQSKE